MVEAEPLQAAGDLVHDVAARQADGIRPLPGAAAHLGGDDHVFARDLQIAQRLAEHDLGLAFRIDVGGVDEVDAGVERALDQRRRAFLLDRADGAPDAGAAAEGHRAEADFRDELAGAAQRTITHCAGLLARRERQRPRAARNDKRRLASRASRRPMTKPRICLPAIGNAGRQHPRLEIGLLPSGDRNRHPRERPWYAR